MDITDTDISLVRWRASSEGTFVPLLVFGYLDEIKEIWTIYAIHYLEFSSDQRAVPVVLPDPSTTESGHIIC